MKIDQLDARVYIGRTFVTNDVALEGKIKWKKVNIHKATY